MLDRRLHFTFFRATTFDDAFPSCVDDFRCRRSPRQARFDYAPC